MKDQFSLPVVGKHSLRKGENLSQIKKVFIFGYFTICYCLKQLLSAGI